ncbi:hypothetical protein [Allomuricauda sp. F6463D]|uniref:hypothetical protein n=1 Tax=Allomuricauda sp. F6463D TaxID=2926409 RepID=UPI001FF3C33C|nr:hypothetical protein [Muricauda sp. F6463D]MCK0159265.1 hypothetical protein [Muricauda sp. F6463D]
MNQNLFWPIVLIGLVLFAVFIWKDWTQQKDRSFWIKSITIFLAISSLVMIVLRPSTLQKTINGKGIVLTEGYRPAQLDSLKSIYKRIRTEEYSKGRTLSILENVDSLFLLGHGVEPFDLWQLQDKSIAFLGGEKVEGWTAITHENEIPLGGVLQLNSRYSNPKEGHWAVLADNGGNPLDSVLFKGIEEERITFNTKPKSSGQFVYSLLEKDTDANVISQEPIPVQVVKGALLKILMINTFPTFESKYLKNFLTERGHEVLARTQLTKGRYKFEYFNGASNPIYGFTQKNLNAYDLLIIDTDTYAGLDSASKEIMEETMKTHGLGVFVQPNERFFNFSKKQSPFGFDRDFVTETTIGEPEQHIQKYPFEFKNTIKIQEVLVDSVEVAAYVPMEKGKLGTTLLRNTYQLVLEGDTDLYANIWTSILNKVVRDFDALADWKALTTTSRVGEPFKFELRTSLNDFEIHTEEEHNIYMLQDILLSNKWTGTQYPRKTGWNQLTVSNDTLSKYSYYVFDENQRKAITLSNRLKTNKRQFGNKKGFTSVTSASQKEMIPIPSFWFFILLILCLGWLWLEPKLVG